MSVDLMLAFGAIALLAVLAGIAVKGLLDAAQREHATDEDMMARAARVGNSQMPEFIARRMRARRAQKVRAELPDALDMVSNSLTAGLTLPQALMRNLAHFPPLVAEEFARILYDTRLGYSIGGAFDNFARRLPFEDELHAMTTEGRMQALVMSALPLVMIVLLGLVKRDLVAPLFTTGAGWGALAVLAVMQGLAYLWIRKIVDIKV